MPIPAPRQGESQDDYLSRCMGDETMVEDFPDESQRSAVCFQTWREDRGESNRLRVKNQSTAELLIYEDIGEDFFFGGLSAKRFKDELDGLPTDVDTIDVRINSVGGAVFEGVAIYNLLRAHSATVNVHIDGIAASIASVIAMAGDTITMAHNAWMMIHDPWGMVMGNADELRRVAEQLDGLRDTLAGTYARKATGLSLQDISELMADETWLNADEAMSRGFIDEVSEHDVALAAYASPLLSRFSHTPDKLQSACQPCHRPMQAPPIGNVQALRPRAEQAREMQARIAQRLRERRL